MTDVTDMTSLERAIVESDALPRGRSRVLAAEAITERARSLGPAAHVKAILNQVGAQYGTDEPERSLTLFATALQIYDEDPSVFDEPDVTALYWHFKFVVKDMLDVPQVPLAAMEGWLAEMGERYAAAGLGDRAVAMSEHYLARHVGDRNRAEAAFGRWIVGELDETGACLACEINGQGMWYVRCGDDVAALDRWASVLGGDQACPIEPHCTLADSLLPLVRVGKEDEARANHFRGYPMVKGDVNLTLELAAHVEFCSLTGNEARALEIVAENPHLLETGNAHTNMTGWSVVAQLMTRIAARGRGESPVPGPAERRWTAAELAEHARSEALRYARRFDDRNGTSAVSTRVQARMDAEPLLARLPLGVRAVLPATTATPASTGPATTTEGTTAPSTGPAAPPDLAPRMPEVIAAAHTRAQEALTAGDDSAARAALIGALDDAPQDAPARWRGATHFRVSRMLAEADDLAGAVHHALEAVAWSDLADGALAAAARSRLGAYLLRQDQYDQALPVLEQALPDLTADDHGEGMIVQVRSWLGSCYSAKGEPAEAARHWLRAAQIAQSWPDQEDHADLASLAAEALGDSGQKAEAISAYRRAADLWSVVGNPERRVMALRAGAWLVRDDDAEEASRIMDEATETCTAAGDELGSLVLAETQMQHARVIADDDTDDSRFQGLFDGALPRAADLAARAEARFRAARERGETIEPSSRWDSTALLAADLAVVTGAPERALTLADDVEAAHPDADEDSWPRPYCRWIRRQVEQLAPSPRPRSRSRSQDDGDHDRHDDEGHR